MSGHDKLVSKDGSSILPSSRVLRMGAETSMTYLQEAIICLGNSLFFYSIYVVLSIGSLESNYLTSS